MRQGCCLRSDVSQSLGSEEANDVVILREVVWSMDTYLIDNKWMGFRSRPYSVRKLRASLEAISRSRYDNWAIVANCCSRNGNVAPVDSEHEHTHNPCFN